MPGRRHEIIRPEIDPAYLGAEPPDVMMMYEPFLDASIFHKQVLQNTVEKRRIGLAVPTPCETEKP